VIAVLGLYGSENRIKGRKTCGEKRTWFKPSDLCPTIEKRIAGPVSLASACECQRLKSKDCTSGRLESGRSSSYATDLSISPTRAAS
jgi:hypothetical protein